MKKQFFNNGDSIISGKYWLYNNLWGSHTGSGSQCLWKSSAKGSNISWGTSWNWTGQTDAIKSFVSVILGWHWGWKLTETGLPIQLSSVKNIHTSWEFDLKETASGGINITYDLWLSTNPDIGNENPSGEIMIWLYKSEGIIPIGSKETIVSIAGVDWELWKGPHPISGWPVYSFVREINTCSQELNLEDFFNYLSNHNGLNNSLYLISVEAGMEVFTGAGTLETSLYSVGID